jgi:hypothetical protein
MIYEYGSRTGFCQRGIKIRGNPDMERDAGFIKCSLFLFSLWATVYSNIGAKVHVPGAWQIQ